LPGQAAFYGRRWARNNTIVRALPRILRISVVAILSSGLWLAYEWLSHMHAHRIVDQGTANEAVVFSAGPGFIALYTGLAIAILIPPAIIGLTLLFPGKAAKESLEGGRASTRKERFTVYSYAAFAIIGICLSAAISGYIFEASHTELRISRQTLAYFAGPYRAYLPLREIRRMELRTKSRNNQIEIITRGANLNIDLSAFAPTDQLIFINIMPTYAKLYLIKAGDPDVAVWMRMPLNPQLIAPDSAK
jgi:hypothetical protein